MSNREILYTKLLTDDASFQLVRTNPKLTGNVKVAINDNDQLWLESIKVNPELSRDNYSKFPIDANQTHASNVYRFFKNGETPNEIIFETTERVDTTKTSKNFKDQYDFHGYFSGIKYLASNKYEERLSYFAPLYLKRDVPNYFVIFKIEDPANFPLDEIKQKFDAGQPTSEYLIDLFKKASLIKTFDLRPESKVGKYLRDYVENVNFPQSPLTVSFEEDDYTTWNGVLVSEGIFGSRGELLYDQYKESTPLKFFEENITNGFSRNGVIFPNILNLEFVFNDDTSEKYDFNRYLGFYVNTIELSKLDIDLDRCYANRGNWENDERFRKKYLETDEVILPQTNSNGVIVPYKNSELNVSEFVDVFSDSEYLYFNYLSDKDGNLYSPKVGDSYKIDYSPEKLVTMNRLGDLVTVSLTAHGYSTDDVIVITSPDLSYSGDFLITKIDDDTFTYTGSFLITDPLTSSGTSKKELRSGQFRFANKSIDLGLFFGQSRNIFLQDLGTATQVPGYSHIMITINSELSDLDEIKFYHPNGTRLDSSGKHDLITVANFYNLVPDAGSFYSFNDFDNVVGYDVFYMNGTGYLNEIAGALANCLNSVRSRTYTAYAYDDKVFIKLNAAGDFDLQHRVSFTSPTNVYSSITLAKTTGASLISKEVSFAGGAKEKGNRLILDAGHLEKITQNLDSILVKSSDSWSKIRKVSQYVDEITEANQLTQSSRTNSIDSYVNKIAVVLEEDELPTIAYKEFIMRPKFRPSFGLLSFFPIKDLDFDFYGSTYTNFPQIDLYNYYFIPENADLILPGKEYKVDGGSIKISLTGTTYSTGSTFSVAAKTSYSIVSGSPLVTYYSDLTTAGSSLAVPILDENEELKDFAGFSILKDPDKVVPQNDTDEYKFKTKYLNGLVASEYDFYKENESLDFALRSKIIPYITKWGIKNGRDARNNPYRLNTELTFGRNNFSPDHVDRTQNPLNFTHEWFYIESKFNYLEDESIVKLNDYYFENALDETQLLSDPDYFINYFTYTPTHIGSSIKEVGETQFRYSNLFLNQASQYEAFFKGFKLTFKDVTDPSVFGTDGKPVAKDFTSRFDGYKFSCILRPIEENINDKSQPPIKYKVIEHKDFKFILVIIELAIGDITKNEDYWKEVPAFPSTLLGVDSGNITDPTYSLELGPVLPFDSINGDYRIEFDNSVSNLTHTLLYSLKNKKYNTTKDNFSTIKMASKLSLAAGVDTGDGTIERLQNTATANYPGILTDDVIVPTSRTVISIKDTNSGFDFFIDSLAGLVPQEASSITRSVEQFLFYDNSINAIGLTIADPVPPYVVLYNILPSGSTVLIDNYYAFKVISGGEKYFEKLFEKLSFGSFKKYVNSLDPFIEYYSYSLDSNGNSVLASNPNFYLEVLDQSNVLKKNQVIPIATEEIPVQFSGIERIGFNYEIAALTLRYELNRYKGEYEPVVKNVLACRSDFSFDKNKIDNLRLSNTRLNSDFDKLFRLENFNHIKIADQLILELESDSTYVSRYPLLKEVAIGQAEYFLLKGNWDWGFHYRYSNKQDFSPVSGALRVEEDESFLGKVVTLPETIELEDFNVILLAENEEINSVDLSQVEIVAKETPLSLTGVINLNNVLTRYLIEDGIDQKFNDFLVNSNQYIGNFNSIEEYVREYIRLNILKLYEVETNEFYSKNDATLTSTIQAAGSNVNSIQFVSLNDQQRFSQGYNIIKSLQINNKDRLILKFTFNKKPGNGLLISPKIKIKFI